MSAVTISPKYQVVIPKEIRERLGLEPGQRVEAIGYDDRIVLVPVRPIRSLRGAFRGISTRIVRDKDRT
jgi:AbrB family looped-hinge helix DNA binding protein